jgi:hypothetical protein
LASLVSTTCRRQYVGVPTILLSGSPLLTIVKSLSEHLVATHLSSVSAGTKQRPQTSVYVISPPSGQTTLKVASLLDQKLQALPVSPKPDAATLLDRIQLLQHLSTAGLIDNLSDVSTAVYEATSDRAGSESSPTPTILLLQGLSNALSDTSRRGGPTQAAAFAANVLRSLTHLSRTHAHLLILVEFDLELRSPATTADARVASTSTNPPSVRRNADFNALHSAFTSQQGHSLSLVPSPTAVSSVIDSGLDTIIAVHDAFGRTRTHDKDAAKKGVHRGKTTVVEVLKDRVGDKTGEWCLWVQ